ncbi:hypothetical protein ABZ930_36530 [Streptomyces sp. NPDC046716]|uniref:hypothetical protein n=1 Tax=Streptomyces sp. NPDC046716 TaxID=3157093 RepID=UPI0033D61E9E
MNDDQRQQTHRGQGGDGSHPDTAVDEVLQEFEKAETTHEGAERDSDDGEAGDALTPNEEAQEHKPPRRS